MQLKLKNTSNLSKLPLVILVIALLLGGALRLNGLNWDQGAKYHPDERFIASTTLELKWPTSISQFLDKRQSPLNPYWDVANRRERAFAYGTLPVYITKAAAGAITAATGKNWETYDDITVVGRALSGLADTAAILIVYLLAARLFGRWTGALAALFYALTVLSIQHSHFYTTDITLNFFIILAIYFATRLAEQSHVKWAVLTGLAIGMALACKTSAAPIVIVVPLAVLMSALRNRKPGDGAGAVWRSLPLLIVAGASAVAGLFIFAPYALLDSQGLIRNFNEQNSILISGEADRPYTRQYFNTAPFLYHLDQMLRWSMGMPLGIAAYIGLGLITLLALRKHIHMPGLALMLAWVLPYFAITGGSHAKFLRYMLPILPILAICAARFITALMDTRWENLPALRYVSRIVGVALGLIVGAGTFWWAMAFSSIYSTPHTANKASQWINANVPKSASIAMDHWEEGIAGLQGYSTPPGTVQIVSYEEDNAGKPKFYAQSLQRADYYVEFSNRLYGTVSRIPDRYPVAREFYRALFNGELGYELVHYSESMPTFAGVTVFEDTFTRPDLPRPEPLRNFESLRNVINGGFADESFSAYDHPLVLVWKKTDPAAVAQIERKLQPFVLQRPYNAQLARAGNREPLLTPELAAASQAGGTFADLFDENSFANRAPAFVWWLLISLLGALTLPITLLACKALPDRGIALARPLGMLILAWLVWMPTSLRLTFYTRGMLFAMLCMLALIGAIVAVLTRRNWQPWLRTNWKLLLIEELAFSVPFIAFIFIRMGNPDLWHPARGGEKPMDFAYLMATVKSSTMPPYDPWFAGGYINYYYYGQYLVSTIIKLSGILPEMGFNLAVATFFALSFAGSWSLAYNMHQIVTRDANASAKNIGSHFAGLLAALLMAVLGNIDGGLRLYKRFVAMGGTPISDQVVTNLDWVSAAGRFFSGVGKWITQGNQALQIGPDWYWASSRIYPGSGSIQEFPFFTFVFADLHAHLMSLPFSLTVLSLAFALCLFVRQASGIRTWFSGQGFALITLAPLALGSLWAINSWDYPSYAVAIGGAMLLGWWHSKRELKLLAAFLVAGGIIAGLSYAMYQPFHTNFVQGYTGFETFNERSPFSGFLTVHGIFLWALLAFALHSIYELYAQYSQRNIQSAPSLVTFESSVSINFRKRGQTSENSTKTKSVFARAWKLFTRQPARAPHALNLLAALEHGAKPIARTLSVQSAEAIMPTPSTMPATAPTKSDVLTRIFGTIMFVLGLALTLRWIYDTYSSVAVFGAAAAVITGTLCILSRNVGKAFAFATITLAMLLIGAVEVWTLKGDIGRMNMVFKFYLQVWTLLSVAAGMGIALLMGKLFRKTSRATPGVWLGRLWAAGMAVLLLIGAGYPVAAAYAKINDRFDGLRPSPTLDGMAYMNTAEYVDEVDMGGKRTQGKLVLAEDRAAINWMRKNIAGSPTILEAPSGPPPHPGLYRWGNRVAIYTGLPTLIGWDFHQRQQRLGTQKIEQRVNDSLVIFSNEDIARTRALIKEYQIDYIYLGSMEKLHYPTAEQKFEQMSTTGDMTRIYDTSGTRIYQINKP